MFASFVLADEVNRATPKTQSALLEAMQERTVTAGGADPRAAAAVPRDGDAEPARDGGHVPAARGAARPVPAEGARAVPDRRRPRDGARADDRLRRGDAATGHGRADGRGDDRAHPPGAVQRATCSATRSTSSWRRSQGRRTTPPDAGEVRPLRCVAPRRPGADPRRQGPGAARRAAERVERRRARRRTRCAPAPARARLRGGRRRRHRRRSDRPPARRRPRPRRGRPRRWRAGRGRSRDPSSATAD